MKFPFFLRQRFLRRQFLRLVELLLAWMLNFLIDRVLKQVLVDQLLVVSPIWQLLRRLLSQLP